MKKVKIQWFVYIGMCVILSLLFGMYHQKVWISSDTTTSLPLAMDWLSGNIWLKGWVMGSNNFFLTEILMYAVGKVLGFSSLTLIYYIPGIAWSILFLGTTAYICGELKDTKDKVLYCCIIGSVLLIVAPWAAYTLLNANSHNNLYAFLIIYLLLVEQYITKNNKAYLIIATLLAGVLLFSEGVTTMVLIVPMACMCVVQILKKEKRFYLLLASVVVSYVIGKLIYVVFRLMGGMETVGIPVGITRPNELIPRCIDWVNQFATFFGLGNYYESAWGIKKIYATLLMLIFVVALLYYAIRFWKLSWKKQSLLFIAGVNIAACIFTKVACTYRYVVVGYYFGFVFVALFVIEMIEKISKKQVRYIAMAIVMAFFAVFAYTKLSDAYHDGKANGDFADMANIIKDNQLGDGYGDYWCASSISFFTDYENQILPVSIHDENGLFPYSELIRKDWYDEKDMHYIVSYVDEGRSTFIDANMMRQTFGEPDQVYETGPYILYYYNQDLSDYCVPR